MRPKVLFLIIAISIPSKEYAQTRIDKSIPVQAGQILEMHFDYPELIRVTTWDGSEVSITGSASINQGENDDAFVLDNSSSGNAVRIRGEVRDIKKLPHRITVVDGEKKMMFRDKAALQEYQQTRGKSFKHMSWGPDIDITLEVKVPRNMQTSITSVYGMVEVVSFAGPLNVIATYGGVDAALQERSIGQLTAETDFGQIYSNLELSFEDGDRRSRDFHTFVSAKAGNGPPYTFESKYGNVYLRKAE